jgi:hypothetical protein
MPPHYDACGAPCPRHEGKGCEICGIGNGAAIFGRSNGPLMFDPKRKRHRHQHMEGQGGFLRTHTWGGGRHGYSFGKYTGRIITEAQYDAIVEERVDAAQFDRWLFYRDMNQYRRERGWEPAPLPEDLKAFIPPPEVSA